MWSFGIFQFLLKIILSPKRVFFTEIPPRPRMHLWKWPLPRHCKQRFARSPKMQKILAGRLPLPSPRTRLISSSEPRHYLYQYWLHTLKPRQNGRHFPDDILKWTLWNENVWISIKISLKFVPKFRINNIPALVQKMAWHWAGEKSLSELMMVSLLTHIWVTRYKWVNLR